MIKVLFFARIREQLKVDDLSIQFSEKTKSVEDLISVIVTSHCQQSEHVLSADNVVIAVNQQIAGKDLQLTDGDEVAFFPPVTGG